MGQWESEAVRWFNFAEAQVAAALKLIGQDNEVVTLGVVVLIGLITLSLVWALLLALLRSVVGLFGGGREREVDGPRGEGFAFSMGPEAEAGRLDVVPSAQASTKTRIEPKVTPPAARPRLSTAAGASKAAGALPISPADDMQKIQLWQLPRLADRGRVVSARPEWTG